MKLIKDESCQGINDLWLREMSSEREGTDGRPKGKLEEI